MAKRATERLALAAKLGVLAADPPTYTVEYRLGEQRRVLDRLELRSPTRDILDPYASRLRLDGVAQGALLLVEAASERVAARVELSAPPRDHRHRFH